MQRIAAAYSALWNTKLTMTKAFVQAVTLFAFILEPKKVTALKAVMLI